MYNAIGIHNRKSIKMRFTVIKRRKTSSHKWVYVKGYESTSKKKNKIKTSRHENLGPNRYPNAITKFVRGGF